MPSNRATPPESAADPTSTATAELHSGSAREYHPVDTAISAAPADKTTATSRRETEPQHVASLDFPARQLRLQQIVPHGVNHFIRFPELTQTMLRTCMLCGQWVASHKVMKLHYRNTHSQTFHQSQQRASRIIEQRATPCTTCHFCGGKHKDWKAHLHKCTALWQCSMLCAMYEEKLHDGRTDGGILRGCQDGKQLPGPVERVLASNDRSPQPLRDAQRLTQTRAVPGAPATATAAAIPFPVRSVPKRSLDHYFGQGRPATTGGTQSATSGHRLHTLPETGRGRGHECVVQGGTDFQGQAGSGAGMAARSATSPNGPGIDHVQGTDGSAEAGETPRVGGFRGGMRPNVS